jgi:hypothetical protein
MVGVDVAVGLGIDEVTDCTSALVVLASVLENVGLILECASLCSILMGLYEVDGQVKCSCPRYKLVTTSKKQKAASSGATIF